MNLYKKCTIKPYSFLLIDITIIMIIDDKIRVEKQQYDKTRKLQKQVKLVSLVSLGKVDKYEYFPCKEILLPNQITIIDYAKFTYSPLGKALEKQT